ncbi:MAG: hypothetical protein D084_Lepto4C00010G0002 [Leptospirillum sp. Group IV 'UBA BS']|nr:MAG: hypothetical protein D084_Lepto4C00010G0002 [Leptospirillum sp. Group IV 'UBA BS']
MIDPVSPSPRQDSHMEFVQRLRKVLLRIDDIIHLIVAIFLMSGAVIVLVHSAMGLTSLQTDSVLQLINDMLFVVIILELLWIMLSYLGRRRFPIASFILIGIISTIRRILLVEAQSSYKESERFGDFSYHSLQLILYVVIVLILVFSYSLLVKISVSNEAENRQHD